MHLKKIIAKEFRKLKKHPKGHLIKRHNDFIRTGFFISKSAADIISVSNRELFFSRKSLKHLSEKSEGKLLLDMLPLIIRRHEIIFQGKKDNLLVVTIFKTDDDYLEDFEILWRTGAD
jgi:hypothetical protein